MTINQARGASMETALILIEILRLLPRKGYISASQICDTLKTSGHNRDVRSVQRLLEQLSDEFPIERDTRNKPYGYRWPEHEQGFHLTGLTPAEALLLQVCQTWVKDFLPAPLVKQLENLFKQAHKTIDQRAPNSLERRWLQKIRRIPSTQPLLPPRLKPGVFEAISEALFAEQKLFVQYVNAQGKRREATVCPLGLALQDPRLYLVCRFDGFNNERILSLTRIQKASLLKEYFTYPKDFDLARYDGEGRFAFGLGQKVQLSFKIDKTVGRHLTESPLSIDQSVIEADTHLAICATVTDSALLHAWLRSLGPAILEYHIRPMP